MSKRRVRSIPPHDKPTFPPLPESRERVIHYAVQRIPSQFDLGAHFQDHSLCYLNPLNHCIALDPAPIPSPAHSRRESSNKQVGKQDNRPHAFPLPLSKITHRMLLLRARWHARWPPLSL